MTTSFASRLGILWTLASAFFCHTSILIAEQAGDYAYSSDGNSATITKYTGTQQRIVVPDTIKSLPVTGIGTMAFSGAVTSVTLPAGITAIGSRAFMGCKGLTSITVPANVTSIGESAFRHCTALMELTVTEGNPAYISMDGILFNKDRTLIIQYPGGKAGGYAVPSGVTSFAPAAFYGCTGLTNISIPASVAKLDDAVFEGCSRLSAIVVSDENPAYQTTDGVLFDKGGTTLIQYPGGKAGDYVIPAGVTSIGKGFAYCYALTGVTFSTGLHNIGGGAFNYCTGLTSVTIPANITSIGIVAFQGCGSLANVIFEGDAPTIGKQAFYGSAPGFTITFKPGAVGFSTPTWQGYPAKPVRPPADTIAKVALAELGPVPASRASTEEKPSISPKPKPKNALLLTGAAILGAAVVAFVCWLEWRKSKSKRKRSRAL